MPPKVMLARVMDRAHARVLPLLMGVLLNYCKRISVNEILRLALKVVEYQTIFNNIFAL
jgi:hypothetical protein